MNTDTAEMPRYQCHKIVHALKIAHIDPHTRIITPAEAAFAPFEPKAELFSRYVPVPGDYYVVYEDGYAAFSPGKVFESGYTRVVT